MSRCVLANKCYLVKVTHHSNGLSYWISLCSIASSFRYRTLIILDPISPIAKSSSYTYPNWDPSKCLLFQFDHSYVSNHWLNGATRAINVKYSLPRMTSMSVISAAVDESISKSQSVCQFFSFSCLLSCSSPQSLKAKLVCSSLSVNFSVFPTSLLILLILVMSRYSSPLSKSCSQAGNNLEMEFSHLFRSIKSQSYQESSF